MDDPSEVFQGKYRFWDFNQRRHVFTDEVLQLSATDIKTGRDCHYKLIFKFTGYKAPKTVPLAIGSVFHAVIEDALKHKASTGQDKPWRAVETAFEAKWVKGIVGVVFDKISPEKAKLKALEYLKLYHTQALPLMYPLFQARFRPKDSIERFFNLKITYNGVVLGLTGKIDFIDKSLWCIDHKTASSPWSQQEADEEIQAQLYPFCLKQLGQEIRGFKFMVVSKGGVVPFDVAYDEKKVWGILEEAFALKRNIEEGNLLRAKNERTCKWCEFNDICLEKICQQ